MPRVLILCEYPTLLGGERSMLATLDPLAADGFDVLIAGPPTGALADAASAHGVEHIPWHVQDNGGQRLPLGELRATLAELVQEYQPNLLHANSLSTSRIAGPVTSWTGKSSVGHLRDIANLNRQSIDDINRHARIVAVSEATRDFHVAQGVNNAKCVVVRNGVDLKLFRPQPRNGYLHRELNLPAHARLIVTIGQLGLRKASDVALAAARHVMTASGDVHWLIVGTRTSEKAESRAFEAQLHARAAEPPLAGRVHFLGSRDDVPQLLPECDALVHTARQEPLGRVLLEAAACGLSVVATDVGGTREIFPSEADGAILVPVDEAAAIAEAATAILEDDARRESLGSGARRRAELAFDRRATVRDLVSVYRQLL